MAQTSVWETVPSVTAGPWGYNESTQHSPIKKSEDDACRIRRIQDSDVGKLQRKQIQLFTDSWNQFNYADGTRWLSYSVIEQPADLNRMRKILRNVDTSPITPSERDNTDYT